MRLLQLYCRRFPGLTSIHTNVFSKLGINIAIDSLKSYNFSGYINSLEIGLKEEYQAWFWRTINVEQGTSGKGVTNSGRMPVLKTIMKLVIFE